MKECTRTAGVLSYVQDLLGVAHAMIDDCRWEHKGEGERIGGVEEDELLSLGEDINNIKDKLEKFIRTYC